MSDKVVVFGAVDGVGAIAGCSLISDTPNESKSRWKGKDSKGNETKHGHFDVKTEYTSVYGIDDDTNGIVDLILGSVMNGRLVTSIQISAAASEENNKVTIISHNHAVNAHIDDRQQVAIAAFLPVGGVPAWGPVDFLGGTAGTNAAPSSGEITFACQHNDKAPSGDHFCGENYDAMVTASTTWEGVPTTPVDAGVWDTYTSKENPVSNTEFKTTKVDATAPLMLATPVITP